MQVFFSSIFQPLFFFRT